jgi:hypothetical protein
MQTRWSFSKIKKFFQKKFFQRRIKMPDLTSPLIAAHPLLGREENMKLLYDKTFALTMGDAIDRDLAHSRARLDIRSERNGVAFDKALDAIVSLSLANLTIASQVGDTEDQSAAGPQVTAEGAEDAANAGISVSAQAVATSLGNLASALVPIVTASAGVVSAQSLAALLATVVTAAGQSAGTSSKS